MRAPSSLLPTEGGPYRIRTTSHTPEGRDVEDESYLWVSGGAWPEFGGHGSQDRPDRPR